MSTSTTTTRVPGQLTLPHMADRLGYGSIKLDHPWMESFCWHYVLSGNNGTEAIKEVKPHLTGNSASVQASKLLRNSNIKQRIQEVREEQKDLLRAKVVGQHDAILDYDPLDFFDVDEVTKNVSLKPIYKLPQWLRKLCTLDTKLVGKNLRTIVVVPDKDKSRSELAKILSMITAKSELSGPGGGPLSIEETVHVYLPENNRDLPEAAEGASGSVPLHLG